MNKNCLRRAILMGIVGLVLMNTIQAASPVWTFEPVSGYPPSVSVGSTETANIKYLVTNQSHKPHLLQMRPIQGITASGCSSPLGYLQSCTLALTVNGSGLNEDVFGGPVLCDHGNPNQCYQPSPSNRLAIRLIQGSAQQQYWIISTTDLNGSIDPNGPQMVNAGTTLTFTAIPDVGYQVNQWLLDGTLVQTGGTTYQLVNITANHSVNVLFNAVTPQYTVTSSADSNGSVTPNGPQTVNSGDALLFTATADAGYGINQWLLDGTLAQTGGATYQLTNITANHNVKVTFGIATLTPVTETLALSIRCTPSSVSCTTTKNDALTGNPRQIVIQNTGSGAATNLSVSAPNLPAGTGITANTCTNTLNAGDSCAITLMPGSIASSTCTSGTQPVASTVTITADDGLSSQVAVYVLGYGCQYQGGFLYSVDDNYSDYPMQGSIGGKVLSLVDQAAPFTTAAQPTSIIWSSNGSGSVSANASLDIIPLIAESSTTATSYNTAQATFNTTYSNEVAFPFPPSSAFATCNGASDGHCNSGNILVLYNLYKTGYGIGSSPYTLSAGPTNPTYYAAGLCTATINTYSDWYLPAICEMDSVYGTVNCPIGAQSIVVNLAFLIGNPSSTTPPPSTSCTPPSGTDCLAGYYWTSTQSTLVAGPQSRAWVEYFTLGGGSYQNYFNSKNNLLGARCSRALTP